jgi:hypothetical protein
MSEPEIPIPTVKCDKCGLRVPKETESRTYHLSLRQRSNNKEKNAMLKQAETIVLCADCDAVRDTNLVKYVSETEG